jgi:hypothetical protein
MPISRVAHAEQKKSIIAWPLYGRVSVLAPLAELKTLNNHPCSVDLAYAGGSLSSYPRRHSVQHNLGVHDWDSEKTAVVYDQCSQLGVLWWLCYSHSVSIKPDLPRVRLVETDFSFRRCYSKHCTDLRSCVACLAPLWPEDKQQAMSMTVLDIRHQISSTQILALLPN